MSAHYGGPRYKIGVSGFVGALIAVVVFCVVLSALLRAIGIGG